MKSNRKVEVQLHPLLTSALHGEEQLASRPGSFVAVETVPAGLALQPKWKARTTIRCSLMSLLGVEPGLP
jgi:hypothetical protein